MGWWSTGAILWSAVQVTSPLAGRATAAHPPSKLWWCRVLIQDTNKRTVSDIKGRLATVTDLPGNGWVMAQLDNGDAPFRIQQRQAPLAKSSSTNATPWRPRCTVVCKPLQAREEIAGAVVPRAMRSMLQCNAGTCAFNATQVLVPCAACSRIASTVTAGCAHRGKVASNRRPNLTSAATESAHHRCASLTRAVQINKQSAH